MSKQWIFRYPGDPPYLIERLTREEFLKRFPDRDLKWLDPLTEQVLEVIKQPPDTIICDLCDEPVEGEVYLYANVKAYCTKCFVTDKLQHCEEIP